MLVFAVSMTAGPAAVQGAKTVVATAAQTAAAGAEIALNTPQAGDKTAAAASTPETGARTAEDGTCDCEHNPFIVIPGITDSDVAL